MAVEIRKSETIHKGWTVLSRVTLTDGEKEFHREVEDHGHAVGVLPYDAARRTALLVQLPRTPVLLAGVGEHLLEAPAGLIDEGEALEASVRREALEECGVELHALEPVGRPWTSPGISTERIALYLAPYSAADRTGPGGGLADEHENITVIECGLSDLAALADAGQLTDLKTLCLVQTLRLRRPELFRP
jgi:nudix-type nucleoside diphosphatase (YffH/AdpP family)